LKALVLAAGRGTRLRPLTDHVPKPLAPVAGRPVVEHLLKRLPGAGVRAAVFNLHWRGDQIVDRLGDGERFGVPLSYVREPELRGTAGAIAGVAPFLGDEDFLVVSADGFHDVDIAGLAARHRASGAAATITVKRLAAPESCAIVEHDDGGLVTRFVEKPAPGEVFTDLASIGIYCFSPAVLPLIPGRPYDIAGELIPEVLHRGLPVAVYPTNAYWNDIGTLAELRNANLAAVRGEARTAWPAAIEEGVAAAAGVQVYAGSRIAEGASLEAPAAIGPLAGVATGALVAGAVVLPGASVPEGAVVRGQLFGAPEDVARTWAQTLDDR
jgi:NDP-sugar pyrophosphorylase family protein